jgi:hypothetical protein
MSFRFSPSIVTDGLVLYVDAANTKSYPGSGTTWSDLSRSGNNGTLVNGPTFNSGNGGSIVFDGTNDRVNLGNILNFGTNDFTIEFWCRKSAVGNTYPKVISKGFYQLSGWTILLYLDSLTFAYGNPQVGAGYLFPYTVTNRWIHGTVVRNSNQLTVYGNSQPGTPLTITNNLTSTFNFTIGNSGTFEEPWGGNVSSVKVYNRALSAQQIQQNYNATKSRFGL